MRHFLDYRDKSGNDGFELLLEDLFKLFYQQSLNLNRLHLIPLKRLLVHVTRLRHFQLDGVDAFCRLTKGPRNDAAFEASIED